MNRITGVTHLRLKYPGEQGLLFKEFSLSVRLGEKLLLLGPSGSGKSTLLQVLSGLVPQAVELPMKADEVTIPHSWGFVFQDPDTQFCMPFVDEEMAFVLENMGIARERMSPLIQQYLKRVGLELEDLHTDIQTLSQGMKQRLAIASVLALEPDVLFLDEPTAMLDPEGSEQVWDTLKASTLDKTVVIVEHKIEHVSGFVDRVVVLNERGEIVADGQPEYVFSEKRELLREYGIWYPGVWDEHVASVSLRQQAGDTISVAANRQDAMIAADPIVTIRGLRGWYGKAVKLELAVADIARGEWICVIGRNGAGKSTLLLSLMKLIRTSGDYRVYGREATSTAQLSGDIAFVFQNPEWQFVTESVEEEAAYSLRLDGSLAEADIRERTATLLREFELADLEARHPYQLSLGQKRRLSVAASIVRGQRLVLLDEPTFGQDARNTFAMLAKLERLREAGATIVMVTHDMKIVEHYATRVWEVIDGRVHVSDRPEADPSVTFAPESAKGDSR
jgi:energy-coupling factor transporter ATP-binding protein EcfA2